MSTSQDDIKPSSQEHSATMASVNDHEKSPDSPRGNVTSTDVEHAHPLALLSDVRKNVLLMVFAVATFVDVCNVSGVAVAVAQISADIKLEISQIVWIITAYSLTFSAFLLFAGRLSDLFPAQIIFEAGFFVLGILSLVTSFVTSNKFGFLILRGLGGIAGAMTIPSAYHLTVHMFPRPEIQEKKLSLLGLAGAIGNVMGLVLAGITMLANYRWFFRVLAIICIAFSIMTVILLPYTPSSYSKDPNAGPRWKRLDIVGVLLMALTLICFILGLTCGPINGWNSVNFIVPFILSWLLGVGFFVWEARLNPSIAVLPSTVWAITNIIIASLATMMPFAFWASSQLQFATYWQEVLHWKPIHVAAAMLPQGLIGLVVGGVAQGIPQIIGKPRYTVAIGTLMMMTAEVLQIYSKGGGGMNYWKFCFPAFLIGSSGAVITFFASVVNVVTSCPPEMAGVAGAWTQTTSQLGAAVVLGVQAGLQIPNISDWPKSSGRGYWFAFAWFAVLGLQYVVFYKTPASPAEEHELARQRMRERPRAHTK